MENWYTQKEVAEILGITKATVYRYAKQGKIKKIPDPHRIYRYVRYEKKEVDQLALEQEKHPTGKRPSEVAMELGLTVPTVLKYIRNGTIQASKVPVGDERTYYVLTPEQYEEAKKTLASISSSRIRKTEYFDSTLDVALFQLFYSKDNLQARVTKNEKQEWGFISKIKEWIPYQEGINSHGFRPAYNIHHDILEPKGYVHFEIPFGEEVLYPFIDYLYKIRGVENVRLREKDSSIYLYVKAGVSPLQELPFSFSDLFPFIIEGKLHSAEQLLIFESTYRKTSLELPMKMLDKVKKLADHENISMSQWVEQAIEQALGQQQHDKYKI